MLTLAGGARGQYFLQTPGPSNVPAEVLRALSRPTIDHRGPEFAALVMRMLPRLGKVFKTRQPVIVYPSSGTGAWEAALVNTLSPGDRVLAFETGHFANLWRRMAGRLGIDVDFVPGDWRHGVDASTVAEKLAADRQRTIRAVMMVHNETSTGVTSDVQAVRRAIDETEHPALLLVDTISSLGAMDYRHDEWGVDVTVSCSQKGLMLPPGLGFNVPSQKALAAAEHASLPRSYWAWAPILDANGSGGYPYTPSTNLLFGLEAAVDMLLSEGLENVFRRHARSAQATRDAVAAWGLDLVCANASEYSNSLTAVFVPPEVDSSEICELILERFNVALGVGLGKLAGRVFRIGHLGHLGDAWLCGALSGVEMGLKIAGVELKGSGVEAAMETLAGETMPSEAVGC